MYNVPYLFGPGDSETYALAMGDVDRDGDLDMVVGNQGEQNAVYLNQVDIYLPFVLKN